MLLARQARARAAATFSALGSRRERSTARDLKSLSAERLPRFWSSGCDCFPFRMRRHQRRPVTAGSPFRQPRPISRRQSSAARTSPPCGSTLPPACRSSYYPKAHRPSYARPADHDRNSSSATGGNSSTDPPKSSPISQQPPSQRCAMPACHISSSPVIPSSRLPAVAYRHAPPGQNHRLARKRSLPTPRSPRPLRGMPRHNRAVDV
jgi:hypothetical protein